MEFAKIKIHSDGATSKVIVNGMDVSMCCMGVTFSHKGGEIPTATLRLAVDEAQIDGEVRVLGTPQIGKWDKPRPEF